MTLYCDILLSSTHDDNERYPTLASYDGDAAALLPLLPTPFPVNRANRAIASFSTRTFSFLKANVSSRACVLPAAAPRAEEGEDAATALFSPAPLLAEAEAAARSSSSSASVRATRARCSWHASSSASYTASSVGDSSSCCLCVWMAVMMRP